MIDCTNNSIPILCLWFSNSFSVYPFMPTCLSLSLSCSHYLPPSLPAAPSSLPPSIPASLPPMFTLHWIRDKAAMLLSVQFHQLEIALIRSSPDVSCGCIGKGTGMKTVVTKTGLQQILFPLPVQGNPGKCPYKVLQYVGWNVFVLAWSPVVVVGCCFPCQDNEVIVFILCALK